MSLHVKQKYSFLNSSLCVTAISKKYKAQVRLGNSLSDALFLRAQAIPKNANFHGEKRVEIYMKLTKCRIIIMICSQSM